jgi:hypothetical protein
VNVSSRPTGEGLDPIKRVLRGRVVGIVLRGLQDRPHPGMQIRVTVDGIGYDYIDNVTQRAGEVVEYADVVEFENGYWWKAQ